MKKNYLLIVTTLCCFTENAITQAPNWLWGKRTGGLVPYDYSQSIAVDGSGNVYTTGSFPATVDFDAGAGTFNMTPAGGTDVFISKSDASGNFLWAKQMGGTTNDGGVAIAVDPGSGAVYISGFFTATSDFDPGLGVYNLTSFGGNDIFVAKLDASGNFVWAKQIGGTSTNDKVNSLTVDYAGSGSVCITGVFWGTTDFDPGAGTYDLTSTGWTDIFIARLDVSGNFVWANRIGGAGNDGGLSATTDAAGNIYITGYFYDTVDFDPGAGTFNLTYAGGTFTNVFVSKYSSSGSFVWAKGIGGVSGYGNGNSIKTDASGNVYTAGFFTGMADFDPGAATYNLASVGGEDIFISKLNSSGNFVWARSMGSVSDDHANSIALGADGSVYTSGQFQATVDFNPGPGTFNLTSDGDIDIYISKSDGSGDFLWAKKTGGTSGDYCKSMAFDATGHLYVTGYFNSPSISFGSSSLVNTDNNGSSPDIFIAKLDISCTSPSALITAGGPTTFCANGNVLLTANTGTGLTHQWKKNGTNISGATSSGYTATSSGSYTVQITNSCGSSTSSPVVVTVNPNPSATITPAGPTTFCPGGSVVLNGPVNINYTYVWKKNGVNISGATLSSYTASSSGTYTVRVTNTATGCSKVTNPGIVVTKNPIPAATITPSGTITFCAGQSALLIASSGTGYTYKWKKNGSYISGATAMTYTVATAGNYRVEVTNSYGCTKTSSADTVVVPCKEGENIFAENNFDVTVYPNPSLGDFVFEFNNAASDYLSIEIFDVVGQLVLSKTNIGSHFTIHSAQLTPGIYSAVVNVGENKKTIRIVKTD